ncbi:MAG: SPFH domain-containing protein [Phycisphaerales bacterium]
MKKLITLILAAAFVLAILSFTITYTVRFNETAVVTTFGKAGEHSIKNEPGLYFKWFYPIQRVTKYDKRLRVVETRSETQLTRDEFQIIVESFITYRVTDPLVFYQRFGNAGERAEDHYARAEDIIRDRLRSALGEVSKFSMGELFTPERGASRLPALEDQILAQVSGDGGLSEYGITALNVGISRVRLPETTTDAVIKRMGANRDKLSKELEAEGQAQVRNIVSKAESDADRIREFTNRRAQEIIARGDIEAVPYLQAQSANQELAVFLQQIQLLREAMAKRMTLILSTDDFGINIFSPGVMQDLSSGRLPTDLDAAMRLGQPTQSNGSGE